MNEFVLGSINCSFNVNYYNIYYLNLLMNFHPLMNLSLPFKKNVINVHLELFVCLRYCLFVCLRCCFFRILFVYLFVKLVRE